MVKSVDEYIAAQEEGVQRVLKRVRATIRKALPDADEVISYSIPAYKLKGRIVVYFAGWKEHFSLYPVTGTLLEEFKDELAGYETSGKGTVRFPYTKPPLALIERLTKFRAEEVATKRQSAGR
jgi:uncharacterized protein YdhG (YjbR/CyaY superfamily)